MSRKFKRRPPLGNKLQQPEGTLAKAQAMLDLFDTALATAAQLDSSLVVIQPSLPELTRLAVRTRVEELVLGFLAAHQANKGDFPK